MSECSRSKLNPFLDIVTVRLGFLQFNIEDYIDLKVRKVTNTEQSAVNHMCLVFLQKYKQCVPETGADKVVDDKNGARIQHDHEPGHRIHHPPGGRDVALALPFHALEYVGNG